MNPDPLAVPEDAPLFRGHPVLCSFKAKDGKGVEDIDQAVVKEFLEFGYRSSASDVEVFLSWAKDMERLGVPYIITRTGDELRFWKEYLGRAVSDPSRRTKSQLAPRMNQGA